MIYTVTFNPALDYVVRMDSLIPGEVNRTAQEEIFFGGNSVTDVKLTACAVNTIN